MAKKPRAKPEPSHVGTYFTSLTVENIRSFGKAQTLDLTKDGRPARWTVILGENNLGKSTLLEVLDTAAAFPLDLKKLVWPKGPSDFSSVSSNMFRSSSMDSSFSFLMTSTNLDMKEKENPSVGLDITSVKSNPTDKILSRSFSASSAENQTAPPGVELPSPLKCTYNLDSGRQNHKEFLSSANDWLLQADYKAKLDTSSPFILYLDQVKKALVNLLPDVQDIRIEKPDRPGAGWPEVQALMPDGLWIPLDRLGSGYQAQIAWMVDFAAKLFERYPDSPDPLAEPAICLIDELDLHLHPKWQRQIVGYLSERFPRTQFIVTAHSPLIVQAAEDANLVLLRREGTEVVIDNDAERLQGWRVDQILASELFGLESVRPPSVEALEKERKEILRKQPRAAASSPRLREIEDKLLALPGTKETAADREAMAIIRAAAAKLKGEA